MIRDMAGQSGIQPQKFWRSRVEGRDRDCEDRFKNLTRVTFGRPLAVKVEKRCGC